MSYKACINCEHFKKNVFQWKNSIEEYRTAALETSLCFHPLAGGTLLGYDKDTHWMIHFGPCGRELKLWEKKVNE